MMLLSDMAIMSGMMLDFDEIFVEYEGFCFEKWSKVQSCPDCVTGDFVEVWEEGKDSTWFFWYSGGSMFYCWDDDPSAHLAPK
jgi:hypothetical protein